MILYIISQIYYSAWHIKSIISDSKDIFIAIQKKSNKSCSFNNFINTSLHKFIKPHECFQNW